MNKEEKKITKLRSFFCCWVICLSFYVSAEMNKKEDKTKQKDKICIYYPRLSFLCTSYILHVIAPNKSQLAHHKTFHFWFQKSVSSFFLIIKKLKWLKTFYSKKFCIKMIYAFRNSQWPTSIFICKAIWNLLSNSAE